MELPTWTVVAMADEPAPLVVAFAQHMLAAGALQVDLFLDGPNPEAEALLAAMPDCRVTVLDAAFWAASAKGRRPQRRAQRQKMVAEIAYLRCKADWLLHCDADELVHHRNRLREVLAEVPDHVTHVSLQVQERVWTRPSAHTYGGAFRRKIKTYASHAQRLHGDGAGLFQRGLSGHAAGKSLTRTGRDLRPTIHFAMRKDGTDLHAQTMRIPPASARLLHFDGFTPLHYAIKMLRYVHDRQSDAASKAGDLPAHRMSQMALVPALAGDPAAMAGLVMRIMALRPAQVKMMRARGWIDDVPFRPRVTPGVAAMLSAATADAHLRARHRGLLEEHAPALLDAGAWDRLVRRGAGWSAEDEIARGEL
jgi:hypothetical protein